MTRGFTKKMVARARGQAQWPCTWLGVCEAVVHCVPLSLTLGYCPSGRLGHRQSELTLPRLFCFPSYVERNYLETRC